MTRPARSVAIALACLNASCFLPLFAQDVAVRSQALLQVNSRIEASVRSGIVHGPAVQAVLLARSELMKGILRKDPASARAYALGDSTRSSIVAADPSAASLLEQDAVVTGELSAAVADDFKHGTSSTLYGLHTFNQDLDLSFAVAIPEIDRMLHRQVTVRGIQLAGIVAAESLVRATPQEIDACGLTRKAAGKALASTQDAAPAVCSTTGVQRIAVILVTFPGDTPAFPAGMDMASYWNSSIVGANPSVNGFMTEVSYGQTNATSDVFGPFALSQAYDCDSSNAIFNAAISAAAATVDLTPYNRFIVSFPTKSCWFDGMGTVGCMSPTDTIDHEYSQILIAIFVADDPTYQWTGSEWAAASHELGHNLGLAHANRLDFGLPALGPLDFDTTGPATPPPAPPPIIAIDSEYGDMFSVMGASPYGPYSAEHRAQLLGWIPHSDQREVIASGTYTLAPAENSSGLRAIRALRDPSSDSWLWMEFHQPTGFYTPYVMDVYPGNTLTSGAQIHYETGYLDTLHTYLLDMTPGSNPEKGISSFIDGTLAPGSSWSDPYSLLTLTAGAQTPSSLGMTVSYDAPCATLSLSASELALAGGTANLTITAPPTCAWSVSSNASWVSFPGATSGNGNATVSFAYSANDTTSQRNSHITAQRQSLPIVQDGPSVTVVGVSPIMASGSSQSFAVTLQVAKGTSNLSLLQFYLDGSHGLKPGQCEVYVPIYGRNFNALQLYLFDDIYVNPLGGFSPGSAGVIANSSCILYGKGSSVKVVGDHVTFTFNLGFFSGFVGTQTLKVDAITSNGYQTVGGVLGIFTVNAGPPTPTPTIYPPGGTSTSMQQVFITDATPGSTIFYTTDGSEPTVNSAQYGFQINVSQTQTIKAIALAEGYSPSPVATAAFTVNLPTTATPVFTPAGGTYTSTQSVSIRDATSGAAIYYTVDGTTPSTTHGTKYASALSVQTTETVNAVAVADGYINSALGSVTYTITLPTTATPVIKPLGGTFSSAQSVTITDATKTAAIYYTTDGSAPSATHGTKYAGAIAVKTTGTINAIAVAANYKDSAVNSQTYTLHLPQTITFAQPAAATYGAKPITLSATSSSALPVTLTLVSGPALLNGSTLTITGAGSVVVAADQAGNPTYAAATEVKRTVTVNKAAITAAAAKQSMVYGSTLPALTYTLTGFVNGDTQATATTGSPTRTTTAKANSPVGSYPIAIAAGTLAAANYTFTYTASTLSVTKAALTVTANNLTMKRGGTVPALTYAVTGLVNGDTQAKAATGAPKLSTTATSKSAAGSYPITIAAGTLAAANYGFAFVNGSLTVTQ